MLDMQSGVDAKMWDWLPEAANEIQTYITRLLVENGIDAHDITARAKSIGSFEKKCARKQYRNPMKEVTDTVAVRVITFSLLDRDRVATLVRDQFCVKKGEDRNPGNEKPPNRRGYDCLHLVVESEKSECKSNWIMENGPLSNYFRDFGGLEIQIRTVASHAWAEFEHDRRYKGEGYTRLPSRDKASIDRLFGAAADMRHALDETFDAIEHILSHPSEKVHDEAQDTLKDKNVLEYANSDLVGTAVTPESLNEYLEKRFPDDVPPSEEGKQFGCTLVTLCGISTIEQLDEKLSNDSDSVRRLMSPRTAVTTIRRLDDELLALYGNSYIQKTKDIGTYTYRKRQLTWRYDRLRGKV